MGKCSICQESGHNKKTCSKQGPSPSQDKTMIGVNSVHGKATFSTSSNSRGTIQISPITRKSDITPTPVKPPLPIETNDKEQEPIKQALSPRSTTIYTPQAQIYADRIAERKTTGKLLKSKELDLNDLIKKLDTIPKPPVIQTTSNFCNGCQTHSHTEDKCPSSSSITIRNDRYDKKCSHCGQYGHNIKTCPELEEERNAEKAEKENGPASWLNYSAGKRFRKPLTATDGPGYIYMYTYLKPKSEKDKDLFKIGMSKHEEGKRRIEVQEARNKEHYRVIYHEPTPYRYLTETVIHRQLKEMQDPRETGDGKTEWFNGSQEYFIRVIKDVIKEVRFAIQNELFDYPSIAHAEG